MEKTELEALFTRSLLGDYDDDDPNEAVHTLHAHGTDWVFERAMEWCRSEQTFHRARGAEILSQLRRPDWDSTKGPPDFVRRSESIPAVLAMLSCEQERLPKIAALFALGHFYLYSAIPVVLPFSQDPDADIRYAAGFTLGQFPDDEVAAEALLKLCTDTDADVRDWSIFFLGNIGSLDTPAMREIFFNAMKDEDQDAKEEAIVALCKRGDLQALPKLYELLEEGTDTHDLPRATEAAEYLLAVGNSPEGWIAGDYALALHAKFDPLPKALDLS